MRNFVDSDRCLSIHTLRRKDTSEDAKPVRRLMSDRQYPSDDCMEPRYIKSPAGSTTFPLNMGMVGSWFHAPRFCNLISDHDMHIRELMMIH